MRVAFVLDKHGVKTGSFYSIIKGLKNFFVKKKIIVNILTSDLLRKNKKKFYNLMAKSEICHFFGGWSFFHIRSFLIATKLKKIRILHTMGFYEPWALNQKKLKKKVAWFFYQKKILLRSNLIHCASHKEKKNLLNLSDKLKIKVLPFGVEKKFFSKKRKKFFLYKKALFFSRIHPVKGIENLINSWKEFGKDSWTLDVVGPKENKYFYTKISNLISNNKNINLLKPVFSDFKKTELFNKYDFLVLPSKNENFGMVILESLARGLPVLTTTDTPWNIIKINDAGWVINLKQSNLTMCLKNIFKLDVKEFEEKSINAINLARNYQTENIYGEYIKTYEKLLGKK